MDTSKGSKEEPAVRISKILWSKGDMDLTQDPLTTFSHWPWGHIPTPRETFLQSKHSTLIY